MKFFPEPPGTKRARRLFLFKAWTCYTSYMPRPRVDTKNALIVKREEYVKTLQAILTGGFCPFCEKHLFKHHRRPLIYRSKHWLVTENSWPYDGARFHFLFIARPHIEATENMPPVMWRELQSLYRKLVKRYRLSGATLMIRSGDTKFTGASVNHLHGHLVVGAARGKKTEPIRALIGFKR